MLIHQRQRERRRLRDCQPITGSPRQRGLDGQSSGELANVVHFLSSVLARFAQEDWSEAYEAYAEVGLPLGNNLPARVMRLRGYGNGIVLPQAQAFIEVVMEYLSED